MFTQSAADRLVQNAAVALAAGQTEPAEAALNAALGVDPNHPMALTKLAEIALQRDDHARAAERLKVALAIEPHFAPAWGALSHAHWLAGRRRDALAAVRRAVHIQPPNPKLRLQLAQLEAWTGHAEAARQALAPLLEPPCGDEAVRAAAISMRGELAIAAGRFHDADIDLRQALHLLPELHATRMMLGMNQLRLGRFADGWANYAARERIVAFQKGDRRPQAEMWQGESLKGRTILVADDQGHGDAIQFFRYLARLKARGPARITLRSFVPLVRLLADAAPYADVLAGLPDEARFDYHCTSSSLPRWFGTTLETIPSAVPYFNQRKARPSAASGASGGKRRRLQVGLAWSGDERHMRDHLRSIPAALFLALTDVPGIRFHSLQAAVRADDLPSLQARPAISRKVEKAVDFADTAALISGLDLVITVDTAVAHLAGAMGKPVWILLHAAPDWRWLTDRSDSPWYPTARLFRVTQSEWVADVHDRPRVDFHDTSRVDFHDTSRVDFHDTSRADFHDTSRVDFHDTSRATIPAGGWGPMLQRVAAALRTWAAG